MPTAVLMMIGQIAVMKMTKIADGWPLRNAASDSGSQASGGTVRSTWKIGSRPRIAQVDWPTSVPSSNADDGGQRVTQGDALQARRHVPEQALVETAAIEERIDNQLPGVVQHLGRRRQRGAGLAAKQLPHQEAEGEHDNRRHDIDGDGLGPGERARRKRCLPWCDRQHFGRCGGKAYRGLGLENGHVHFGLLQLR